MEMFKSAKAACLRSRLEKYLIAADDEEHVCQDCNGAARWTVEFVPDATAVLRLKSCYGRYLTVSNEPFLLGVTGHKVLQTLSSRPDTLVERERVCAKVSGSSSKPGKDTSSAPTAGCRSGGIRLLMIYCIGRRCRIGCSGMAILLICMWSQRRWWLLLCLTLPPPVLRSKRIGCKKGVLLSEIMPNPEVAVALCGWLRC